jgi:hypothetical protein
MSSINVGANPGRVRLGGLRHASLALEQPTRVRVSIRSLIPARTVRGILRRPGGGEWARKRRGTLAWLLVSFLVVGAASRAAEKVFDFSTYPEGEVPAGFRSTLVGEGRPGEWRVIAEDVTPSAANPFLESSIKQQRVVLAQLSTDPTDERFPLLIYDEATYDDFTFTVRVKTMGGQVEQMAGIAFRLRDEANYYALRISTLGKSIRFYKVVEGIRSPPIGTEMSFPTNTWFELGVQCKGNVIQCLLDGKPVFPLMNDNSFVEGKIGFWTKSDAVSHFAEARLVYTPVEPLGQVLVRQVVEKYGRLLNVKLYAAPGDDEALTVVGC